jgi:acyl-CoA dehydrogenase
VEKVFLQHCVDRLVAGTLDPATASMAKYWITEAPAKIIEECLQLFGGYGYMLEYPISDMYKDARAYRIYGGTTLGSVGFASNCILPPPTPIQTIDAY